MTQKVLIPCPSTELTRDLSFPGSLSVTETFILRLLVCFFVAKTQQEVEVILPQFSKVTVTDFFQKLVCWMLTLWMALGENSKKFEESCFSQCGLLSPRICARGSSWVAVIHWPEFWSLGSPRSRRWQVSHLQRACLVAPRSTFSSCGRSRWATRSLSSLFSSLLGVKFIYKKQVDFTCFAMQI